MENHHLAVTFQILDDPECNILSELSRKDQELIRKDINILILATDMARHADILMEFKKRSPTIADDSMYLKMILIKACDVSNEIRPTKVSEPWAERLLQEYFKQVQLMI